MKADVKAIDGTTGSAASSWLQSATVSVVLTTLIMVIAIAVGAIAVEILKIAYGWTFIIAVIAVIAEIWLVLTTVKRLRGSVD